SNPDRVLFPELGVTKLELARYYELVADFALPQLAERPLTLLRCPEGVGAECFYQKHFTRGMAASVPRIVVNADEEPYGMAVELSHLISLVQFGALEIHVWGSRAAALEK